MYLSVVAFLGALLAAIAVYFLGSLGQGGTTPLKLTIAGAALTALVSSITNYSNRGFKEVS
ncbi:iron chelate uptake ABC transporter family permease subunit [Nostoc sp.]|uniref:iron chelate uptake ABC transporter family permease subunit n=1 Tax=Nostoc sp. TaxID=1180 RepID=UPI003FA564B8